MHECGNFLEGELFKRFLDSRTAKPSKELLHSIGENSHSGDDSKESGDVVCVCLKQCFDHNNSEPLTFTVPGSRVGTWRLHTRPLAQCFRPVTGCPSGSLTSRDGLFKFAQQRRIWTKSRLQRLIETGIAVAVPGRGHEKNLRVGAQEFPSQSVYSVFFGATTKQAADNG